MNLLLSGAAAALTLGALSGLGMRPDMNALGNRPMGPQMFADRLGEGSTGPSDGGAPLAAGRSPPPGQAVAWQGRTAALGKTSYDEPPAAATSADDPGLSAGADDTTVAERAPDNPAREPAYDTPADKPSGMAQESAGH